MKKLKTTTTTTLRTTTTVRRVCVMASKGPDGQMIMTEVPGASEVSGTEQLMLTNGEDSPEVTGLPQAGMMLGSNRDAPTEIFQLRRVSGDAQDGTNMPANITQLTIMKPKTTTSESVEV